MGKRNKKPQQQQQREEPPSITGRSTHSTANAQNPISTATITIPTVTLPAHEFAQLHFRLNETEKKYQDLQEEYRQTLKQLVDPKLQVERLQEENQQLRKSISELKQRVQELEAQLREKDVQIAALKEELKQQKEEIKFLKGGIHLQNNHIMKLNKEAELRNQRIILGEVGFAIERRLREKMSIRGSKCTINNIRSMVDKDELSDQAKNEWNKFVNDCQWNSSCDNILEQLKKMRLSDAHGNNEDLTEISKENLLDFADCHLEDDSDYRDAENIINILDRLTPSGQPLLFRPPRPPRRPETKQE